MQRDLPAYRGQTQPIFTTVHKIFYIFHMTNREPFRTYNPVINGSLITIRTQNLIIYVNLNGIFENCAQLRVNNN
jgi:hypothetical protein